MPSSKGSPDRLYPTDAFNAVKLVTARIPAGRRYGRIYKAKFADPLGYGKAPTRFADPRRRKADNRFGVLYLGQSLEVCFVEAILRDKRNGAVADWPMDYGEFIANKYALVRVSAALRLVDLRRTAPIRMGIPSDVAGAASQMLSRQWSLAFHDHPEQPDGIIYPSRLIEATNLAVFDRAVGKLQPGFETLLKDASGLAKVLGDLNVAIDPATLPLP